MLKRANSVEEQPEQQDHRNRHADQPQQDTLAHFFSLLLSKKNDPRAVLFQPHLSEIV
jgi:hypothetical protein